MVAEYLDKNYDRFFNSFTTLILSTNYVTKRQSLKLLGEILLDRANFNVMTRYISNDANLKMMMNLLRDKSKNIQFEAFHVFKVFVANPKKPPQIEAILRRNKDKLLVFLKDFHNDKDGESLLQLSPLSMTQSRHSHRRTIHGE
jgi:calcium binding protein 39